MANRNDKSTVSLGQLTPEASQQLFENVASWLLNGSINNLDLNGTPEQIAIVKEAMIASKKFHDELMNPTTNLTTVSERLESKHAAANRFQETFGLEWML